MKKIKGNLLLIALLVLILLIVGVYAFYFRPIKKAVNLEDVQNTKREYIIVKWTQTTEGMWTVIGNQSGMFDEPRYIEPQGNIPDTCIRFLWGDNTFVWYGDYANPVTTMLGNQHLIFRVEQWDVLYPINHNSIFQFISKRYLCPYDTKKDAWL